MNTAPLRHAIASALLLLGTAALAAPPSPPAPPAPPAELAAKRAELDRLQGEMAALARRMADLSREVGGPAPRMVMHRAVPPRIGLGVVLGEAADGGARIAAVTPGGPAAKAGLKAGDIVRSVHGRNVASPEDLVAALRGIQKGQAVNVGYLRNGRSAAAAVVADELAGRNALEWSEGGMRRDIRIERRGHGGGPEVGIDRRVEVITGLDGRGTGAVRVMTCINGEGDCDDRDLRRAFRFRGLNLAGIDADLGRYFGAERGALLIARSDALPGLRSGDVITAIDGEAVTSPRDVMRALGDADTGDKVTLRVLRNRASQDIEITVPEGRPLDFLPPPPPAPPAPPAGAASPAPPAPPTPPPPAGGTTPAI